MDRPLRVVMPALTFVPGHMGGSETYAREIIRALAARADIELTVIVSASGASAIPNVDELVVDRVRGGQGTFDRLRSLVGARVPGRAARALMEQADVVHYPFTVSVPRARRVPWVQTLFDVQHRDLPEMFSTAERAYRAVAYDRAATRAPRILTISDFSRRRIVDVLGVDPGRVDVAPLGVDRTWFSAGVEPRGSFVFYPAAAWPHKNHARLVQAIALLRDSRPGLHLVLTGAGRDRLGPLPDWVEHRGRVDAQEVLALYRGAAVMAFPSLYEGFGLPLLEAMSVGCRVAAARSGAIPEVCGDAAVLFDGEDVVAIAEGIATALDAGDRLREAGVERARRLTWSASAEAHVRSFGAAAGPPVAG